MVAALGGASRCAATPAAFGRVIAVHLYRQAGTRYATAAASSTAAGAWLSHDSRPAGGGGAQAAGQPLALGCACSAGARPAR